MSIPSLDYYKSLANGGDYNIKLSQDEACVALKIYDYGVECLSDEEKQVLYRLVGQLKDKIWP